ncbi:hypothetical protein OS493_001774 [Desmophyllum pertusum]|uniref:Uncharacterized protein n=1 Tax=Desmophyllum pertusum TaxID=174260 RepID=A0A9X0CUU2_9CNID|nr:hypothetical protein OS493_001774 [Desmophyllum pertusum]
MERKQRRTSGETRFELNAVLSVFSHSRAILLNTNQQLQQVLVGTIPQEEVSFFYNQDLSLAFDSNAASGIPPVNELFGGFIGFLSIHSHSSQYDRWRDAVIGNWTQISVSSTRKSHAGAGIDNTTGNNVNSKNEPPATDSKERECLSEVIDWDEIETYLAQSECDEF